MNCPRINEYIQRKRNLFLSRLLLDIGRSTSIEFRDTSKRPYIKIVKDCKDGTLIRHVTRRQCLNGFLDESLIMELLTIVTREPDAFRTYCWEHHVSDVWKKVKKKCS